jgi:hypothetical protein
MKIYDTYGLWWWEEYGALLQKNLAVIERIMLQGLLELLLSRSSSTDYWKPVPVEASK